MYSISFILFVVFVVLKLASLVAWSWWIVLSPLAVIVGLFILGQVIKFWIVWIICKGKLSSRRIK